MPARKTRRVSTAAASGPPSKRVKVEDDDSAVDGAAGRAARTPLASISNSARVVENAQHEPSPRANSQRNLAQDANARTVEANSRTNPVSSSAASVPRHGGVTEDGGFAGTQSRSEGIPIDQEESCDRDDIKICPGAQDPDDEQTGHILFCQQCWSKLSNEIFSQQWYDMILRRAVTESYAPIVEHLISCGANSAFLSPAEEPYGLPVYNNLDNEICTALHLAIEDQDLDTIKVLCKKAATLNKHTSPSGFTALNLACKFGKMSENPSESAQKTERHYAIILTLLEAGADANLPDQSEDLPIHTFLKSSAKNMSANFSQVFKELIDKTADLTVMAANGERILAIAARCCKPAVDQLLALGLSPKLRNKDGTVPLHHVDFVESYQTLLDKWPDALQCGSTTTSGLTPLHTAVLHGRTSIVKAIIELDPKHVHQMTHVGQNCLHLVRFCRNTEAAWKIMQYLLKKKCNPKQEDDQGRTVLRYHVLTDFGLQAVAHSLGLSSVVLPSKKDIINRLNLLLGKRPEMLKQNREGKTILGTVLFSIAFHDNSNDVCYHTFSDRTGAYRQFESHINHLEVVCSWVSSAKVIIAHGGEITTEERGELLLKKPVENNEFLRPFIKYLEKHEKFDGAKKAMFAPTG